MVYKIPNHIKSKIDRDLFLDENHPICIIKEKIYEYFGNDFCRIENFPKIVSVKKNFDDLLISEDHPARLETDTYYVDDNNVLRTHMTCNVGSVLEEYKKNKLFKNFLFTGDVYRKDEIDSTHFPVFHQMDGLILLEPNVNPIEEIKEKIGGLINFLFPDSYYFFKEDFYPFNSEAFEVNVEYKGKNIEVLGCGIKKDEILNNFGVYDKKAWGFGLGLDRLAMIFFDIPDIRLLWSEDLRFKKQFKKGVISHFKPFSNNSVVTLDISFYHSSEYHLNDFYETLREETSILIENAELIDSFFNIKENMESKTFRIYYSSFERNITREEAVFLHDKIKEKLQKNYKIKIR
jgi:phenylalanyl-tRNA synthetase alpha chain